MNSFIELFKPNSSDMATVISRTLPPPHHCALQVPQNRTTAKPQNRTASPIFNPHKSFFYAPKSLAISGCRASSPVRCESTATASKSGTYSSRELKSSSTKSLLRAQPLTPHDFAPYGQVVGPTEDGTIFGPDDAQLDVSQGTPRVYVMRLRDKPLIFDKLTHHAKVTQCLGAIGTLADPWYLAVAPPSIVPGPTPSSVQSPAGHHYVPPQLSSVAVFRISGPQVVKLHKGTWHAGPFFLPDHMDFCNLELADTNVVDHTSHLLTDSKSGNPLTLEIVDPLLEGSP